MTQLQSIFRQESCAIYTDAGTHLLFSRFSTQQDIQAPHYKNGDTLTVILDLKSGQAHFKINNRHITTIKDLKWRVTPENKVVLLPVLSLGVGGVAEILKCSKTDLQL